MQKIPSPKKDTCLPSNGGGAIPATLAMNARTCDFCDVRMSTAENGYFTCLRRGKLETKHTFGDENWAKS